MANPLPIRRALISVSDKSGIVELAKGLVDRGVELLSTGAPTNSSRTTICRSKKCPNTLAFPK